MEIFGFAAMYLTIGLTSAYHQVKEDSSEFSNKYNIGDFIFDLLIITATFIVTLIFWPIMMIMKN